MSLLVVKTLLLKELCLPSKCSSGKLSMKRWISSFCSSSSDSSMMLSLDDYFWFFSSFFPNLFSSVFSSRYLSLQLPSWLLVFVDFLDGLGEAVLFGFGELGVRLLELELENVVRNLLKVFLHLGVVFRGNWEDIGKDTGLDLSHLGSAVPGPDQLVHSPQLFPHRGVEVVLDGVVGPIVQPLGYFLPLIPQLLVGLKEDCLLLLCPGVLVDFWVQVVVPATLINSHRYRHCLPERCYSAYMSYICLLISVHRWVPYFFTRFLIALSSYRYEAFTSSDHDFRLSFMNDNKIMMYKINSAIKFHILLCHLLHDPWTLLYPFRQGILKDRSFRFKILFFLLFFPP